jgi:hypothetical protein
MTSHIDERLQHKAAKFVGFLFLFCLIGPLLNWAFVLSRFVVSGNAIATGKNIIANEFLFRLGVMAELIMAVGLIVLALALYAILKPVNRNLALLALLLKLVEATLVAAIVLVSFIALQVLSGDTYFAILPPEQLQAPVGFLLNQHTALYAIPMVFLGLDMMIFSYLFYKSMYIPRALASFGIVSFALIFVHALMFMLAPQYATMPINQIVFFAPSGLFEIIIGFWLLSKGLKIEQTNRSGV